MSVIKIPVRYEGSNGERVLYTLFDSGATFSCINPEYASLIADPDKIRVPLRVATASENAYLFVEERIAADFYINDVRMSDEFMVIPDLTEDVIIGATTMQKWRIKLDFEHDTVVIDPKVAKAILKDLKVI